MNNPTVLEIVRQWLEEHGYDGLYTSNCGCPIDDLAPCAAEDGERFLNCRAGYKQSREHEKGFCRGLWIGPTKADEEPEAQ